MNPSYGAFYEPPAWVLSPRHHELVVPMLHWLKRQVALALGERLNGVNVEVTVLCHHGSNNYYPVIGLQLEDHVDADQMESLYNSTADRILETATLTDFLRFAVSSKQSWSEVTRELLAEWPRKV